MLSGIPGSTLLLLLGIYLPAITALSCFLHGDFAMLPGILVLLEWARTSIERNHAKDNSTP